MRDQQTIKHKAWKHPSENPRQKKAEKIAAKRRANMKFANEAEKADYERLIKSNVKNERLYGYPRMALFPPSRIAPMSCSTAGLAACQCAVPNAVFDGDGEMYLNCRNCGEPILQSKEELMELIEVNTVTKAKK